MHPVCRSNVTFYEASAKLGMKQARLIMPIERLDHVNLRTTRLDEMVSWYEQVVGLKTGPRPPFEFAGAWLYAGDDAIVHLVAVDAEPDDAPLKLEHFALQANGLSDFLQSLERFDVPSKISAVPDFPIVQVNIWDPDGNHIHVDFPASEAEGLL